MSTERMVCCPACLGVKKFARTVAADVPKAPGRIIWVDCEACWATGLVPAGEADAIANQAKKTGGRKGGRS